MCEVEELCCLCSFPVNLKLFRQKPGPSSGFKPTARVSACGMHRDCIAPTPGTSSCSSCHPNTLDPGNCPGIWAQMVPSLVVGMLNVNTFRRTTFLREDPALCAPAVCEVLVAGFPPPAPAPSSPSLSFVMNSFPKQVGAHRL